MTSSNKRGPKKAILYARVSTDEQARSGYSLAQQLEALRDYAAREGYEVLEEVTDPGQSGASLERPGMDRVRDLVATGGVAVVLAQDRDRFAREPAYHYLLREEFAEHGTKIRALNDRGDESPEGQLTDGILDQLAKYERAKTAERTRRGKLRRVREGKILPVRRVRYGFRLNAARDGYLIDEAKMPIVRRIFSMVEEGVTLHGVVQTLNREGVEPPEPGRSGLWSITCVRGMIEDDVYRPHSFEEMGTLVAPEVVARLNPSRSYGLWWFNRKRTVRRQVAEYGSEGRIYRNKSKTMQKPMSEWIAVPDSGVPREVVDRARAAIRDNRPSSSSKWRFWELSGGLMRCGGCGRRMTSTAIMPGNGRTKRYFDFRCTKPLDGSGACPGPKIVSAEKVETKVWQVVSSILKDPKTLRADLDAVIESERVAVHSHKREAKAWVEKLAEADRKRSRCQDMAAEGLITFEELGEKLLELEDARKAAQRELEALKGTRDRITELEQDRDALLGSLIQIGSEALDTLTPDEKHQLYRILRLEVVVREDRTVEVNGAFGDSLDVSKLESQCRIALR